MSKLFFIFLRDRVRRYKRFVINKPIIAVGVIFSIISIIYILIDSFYHSVCISDYLDNQLLLYAVMIYLVAKIINPTQGMTIDYQLLELKLISFLQFKFLIGVKLLGGSFILSLVCMNEYTSMVAIISAMNAMVNVWIFLRNRWNNRAYDLIVSGVVIVSIKFEFLYLAILSIIIMLGIFIMIKRVNYADLLPLYKFMYKATQLRYMGTVYSTKETKEIEVNAETLLGKPKDKYSDWCIKLYDNELKFAMCKEIMRILANYNKIIVYFIIGIIIGISKYYIPSGYHYIIYFLFVMILVNFDFSMNKMEAQLLVRGFIRNYRVSEIIKSKVLVYSGINFVFMLPTAILGWKWLLLAVVCSFVVAFVSLYKCFHIR